MKKVSRGGSQEFWGILYHRRRHIYKPSYRLGLLQKTKPTVTCGTTSFSVPCHCVSKFLVQIDIPLSFQVLYIEAQWKEPTPIMTQMFNHRTTHRPYSVTEPVLFLCIK